MSRCAPSGRTGFTFVEVIACLLVLTMGMLGAIALVLNGISRSVATQAAATATATAMSVAIDDSPLTDTGSGTGQGFVNGYFVMREERDGGTSIPGAAAGGFTTRIVTVRVYDVDVAAALTTVRKSHLLAAQTQRLVRRTP